MQTPGWLRVCHSAGAVLEGAAVPHFGEEGRPFKGKLDLRIGDSCLGLDTQSRVVGFLGPEPCAEGALPPQRQLIGHKDQPPARTLVLNAIIG